MKRLRTLASIICAAPFIFGVLSGCVKGLHFTFPSGGLGGGSPDTEEKQEEYVPSEEYSGENDKIADFSTGLSGEFYCSDGWTNGGMFDCYWSSGNVVYDAAKKLLRLTVTDGGNRLLAGEYRSGKFYGYGYYAVKMKPIAVSGVVSSMFTYTGPSDRNPWHEIDIEFLGNDTTKVQFNYFTNGAGGHEKLYSLGFDASKDLHEYGFKWESDRITWFVDGKAVYCATQNIPSVAGRIMLNAWPGKSEGKDNVVGWSGRFEKNFPVPDAEYEWISYKPLAA